MIKGTKCKSLCVAILLVSVSLNAQKFYSRFSLGYSRPIASQSIDGLDYYYFSNYLLGSENRDDDFAEGINVSFGEGLHGNMGLGWYWTESLSLELNFSYSYSRKFKSEQIIPGDQEIRFDLRGKMFSMNPAVVFNSQIAESNFSYYSRMGLIVGISTSIVQNENYVGYFPVKGESNVSFESKGSIPIGFNGALGIKWKLPKLALFAELDFRALSYSPKNRSMTSAENNGESVIEAFSTRQKEIEFVEVHDRASFALGTGDTPRKVLERSYSFSSIGLNIGVQYDLF